MAIAASSQARRSESRCTAARLRSPACTSPSTRWRSRLRREIRSRHPGLREALVADARVALFHRGDRHELRSGADAVIQILRLIWASDAFLAQALYRLKAALQRRGVPIAAPLAHRLAMHAPARWRSAIRS